MTSDTCAAELKQRFPALFGGAPKPLKLRIHADIQARAPGVFTKPVLSAFFRRYTGSTAYLLALTRATHRYDLDGQPGDELSDEHRQAAQQELARRRELHQARREKEDEERRRRAALLRDFNTTTLTPANFCALKGIAPEDLEPLLAQARQEAAEAPRHPPRPADGRGRPPQREARRDGPPQGRRGPPHGKRPPGR